MKTFICLFAIAFAVPSQAAILITNGFPSNPHYNVSGIRDLVVDGVHYDVAFSQYSTFNTRFGAGDPPSTFPMFYFDAAGAIAARNAILEAFNAGPNVPVEVGFSREAEVAYRDDIDPANYFRTAAVYHNLDFPGPLPPWRAGTMHGELRYSRDFGALVFAEFTPVVPEPASIAAWLGIFGVVTVARMRRSKA